MTSKSIATFNHNNGPTTAYNLPGPSAGELLEREIEVINEISNELGLIVLVKVDRQIPDLRQAIERAETFMSDIDSDIVNAVDQAKKKATRPQISSQVAVLVAAFPQAGKADSAYGRILCEDVGAQEPSVGALDIACRKLRRNGRFLPIVGEVLEVLAKAEDDLEKVTERLRALPKYLSDVRSLLDREMKRAEFWQRSHPDFKD
jgi:hypothetical protein